MCLRHLAQDEMNQTPQVLFLPTDFISQTAECRETHCVQEQNPVQSVPFVLLPEDWIDVSVGNTVLGSLCTSAPLRSHLGSSQSHTAWFSCHASSSWFQKGYLHNNIFKWSYMLLSHFSLSQMLLWSLKEGKYASIICCFSFLIWSSKAP